METFGGETSQLVINHFCCDVCHKICSCAVPEICPVPKDILCLESNQVVKNNDRKLPQQSLSEPGRNFLRKKLHELREEKLSSLCENTHCSLGMISGFPLYAVDEIVKIAALTINEETLYEKTSIMDKSIVPTIMNLIQEAFSHFDTVDFTISNDSNDTSETESEEESDDEIQLNRYPLIPSSDESS